MNSPLERDIVLAARIAHEVNRAYCLAIGDTSIKPWDEAHEWQRNSCITGMRFLVMTPRATPKDSHAAWLRTKHAEGWTWGPTKDENAKKHPCMVDYEKLPMQQQIKDHLFQAVGRTVLGIG